MKRRNFLQTTALAAAALASGPVLALRGETQVLSAAHLPRWRGFNLLEKFSARRNGNPPFKENDFELMVGWNFDFARLPMSYLCWATADEPTKLREDELKHVEQAVELGRKHRVHINLNLHRAPGYCVNPPKEPLDLWSDSKALDACTYHWAHFARRFKGIPSDCLSFDLVNEPAHVDAENYVRVVKHLVQAIHAEDPQRLVIADGLDYGTKPVTGLVGSDVAQSTRGYQPFQLTHYKANWVEGSSAWPEPAWPFKLGDKITDRETLRRENIVPWQELGRKGVGIHVGEWGVFNYTPHAVALAWMRDSLALWKEAGWGWALWNLRGAFGVLDSNRVDVTYEDFQGHKLDREMLKVLQAG